MPYMPEGFVIQPAKAVAVFVAPPEKAVKVKNGSRQAEIRTMLAQKLAYAEIARRLDMHHTTIMYHARKLAREIEDAASPRPARSLEIRALVLPYVGREITASQIAKELRVDRMSVQRALRQIRGASA